MPFFGLPIRNGLPIGLGSVAGFGVQQFDPSQLFVGGTVAGAWYDPSDLSTMFTTDAGTTPVAMPGGGAAVSVGRMLDKSGNGNHAIAFNNTTARPELRARVNLLTYSEQFDNAYWTKTNGSITANNITAPNGTSTARLFVPVTSAAAFFTRSIDSVSSAAYTVSVYVKYAGFTWCRFIDAQGNKSAFFNLQTGQFGVINAGITATSKQDVGNGWWKISITSTVTFNNFDISPTDGDGVNSVTGDGTSGIYIWGADLRPANIGANVPAYQRIADANTYDTSGFPLYLRFDGADDSMYTPANLNLSGTDKVAVFAGVRKLSDAALAIVAETSPVVDTNNGAMAIGASIGGAQRWTSGLRGTSLAYYEPATYAAPVTNVFSTLFDIAGAGISNEIVPRINGVVDQDNPFGASAGTGNFGNYPLFIGARNNAGSWLNGHLYSLAVVGSAVSAGNIAAMESWVAGRTGIQI